MNILDIAIAKKLAGGGGGSGTDNYNDLSNLPKINDTTLSGNKSSSALGLQSEINSDSKLASDLVDDTNQDNKFVTSTEKNTWNGKQNAIDADHKINADYVDDSTSTNKFVTSTEKNTWNAKQNAIDSDHKLSSDLVDDANKTNKFVTSTEKNTWNAKQNAIDSDHKLSSSLVSFTEAEAAALASGINSSKVGQISTNQTNILLVKDATEELVDEGAKNLFPFPYSENSRTQHGITFLPDSRGVIHITGTNDGTANSYFPIISESTPIPILEDGETYVLVCNVTGTGIINQIYLNEIRNGSAVTLSNFTSLSSGVYIAPFTYNKESGDTGENCTIKITSGSYSGEFDLYISIMVCKKALYDVSQTYQPYVVPTETTTTALISQIDNGAKNMLDLSKATSISVPDEFSYTINADKSLTLSWSNLTTSRSLKFYGIPYISGKMVLSGCPDGGSSTTYRAEIRQMISGTETAIAINTATGKSSCPVFELENDEFIYVVRVSANMPVGSITLYPMLCRPIDWDMSMNYAPPALPNYDLTRLEAEDRASLAEVVDSGAKNLFPLNTAETSTSGGQAVFNVDNLNIASGTYVFSFTENASSVPSSGNIVQFSITYTDSTTENMPFITTAAKTRSVATYTFAKNIKQIKIYAGYVGCSLINIMCCTKAAFGVSQKFVPYCKSNYELTQDKLNRCSKQLTSGSLNNIKDNEIYYVSADVTDMPTASRAWGFVRTTMYGNDKLYGMQEFFSVTDPCESYFRVIRNGTWQPWIKTGGN